MKANVKLNKPFPDKMTRAVSEIYFFVIFSINGLGGGGINIFRTIVKIKKLLCADEKYTFSSTTGFSSKFHGKIPMQGHINGVFALMGTPHGT